MKRLLVAFAFIVLAFISSFAVPYSGLLNIVWQQVKPCTLAEQILAANTDMDVRNCPAGNGHDTIELTHDVVLTESLPAVESRITVRGNGHTISGADKYQIFSVYAGDLTIEDLRLISGNSVAYGAAIDVSIRGDVTLIDSMIKEHRSGFGPAIRADTNGIGPISLQIIDSIIMVNGRRSRALVNRGGVVTIKNTRFGNNYGGAIYNDGEMTVENSSFHANRNKCGGAIYNERHFNGLALTVVNSWFTSNTADTGGAIYNRGNMKLEQLRFRHNDAKHYGGAVYSLGGVANVSGGKFEKNKAKVGGAIYIDQSSMSIDESTFVKNSAFYGGGIYRKAGNLEVQNNVISGNSGYPELVDSTDTLHDGWLYAAALSSLASAAPADC